MSRTFEVGWFEILFYQDLALVWWWDPTLKWLGMFKGCYYR